MITDRIVYFQPLNNVAAEPVEKHPFNNITRVIKRYLFPCTSLIRRRHSLRHIGLELIMEEDYSSKAPASAFFAFQEYDP